MVNCVMPSCKNTLAKATKEKNGITFHRFPRDKELRSKWEVTVNRDNWLATHSSAVCSEHFDAQEFYFTEDGLRRLSIEAVPSINISVYPSPVPTTYKEAAFNIRDAGSEQVVSLKCSVKRLEVISAKRKRRINMMGQKRKELKRKLQELKRHIQQLIRIKNDTLNMNIENLPNLNI